MATRRQQTVIVCLLVAAILSAGPRAVAAGARRADPEQLTPKILLVVYDPIIESRGSRRMHDAYCCNDPVALAAQVRDDLARDSHGVVNYRIVETRILDEYPYMEDGFRYDDASFDRDFASKQFHGSRWDYTRFISDQGIVPLINSGAIDEVWVYAGNSDAFRYWESTMAGPGSYWCNSTPVPGIGSNRPFVIMNWNFDRGVGEAIHSYGHRLESIMTHVYGSWPKDRSNNWGRFTLLDKDAPGQGGVGNVHFPVNGESDYDYRNLRSVTNNADDWYNYPNFAGSTRSFSAVEWSPTGSDPQREYLNWWYAHVPRFSGVAPDEYLNNWWRYIADVPGTVRIDPPTLPKPKLTAVVTPAAAVWGRLFSLVGSLTSSNAAGLDGRTVRLFRAGTAGWSQISTATTDSSGSYAFNLGAPPKITRFYVDFAGDSSNAVVTSAVASAVVRVGISINQSAQSVARSVGVSLSGSVRPPRPGRQVRLLGLTAMGWRTIGSATLGPQSTYRFTVRLSGAGSRLFRTEFPGDTDYAWNLSRIVRVNWI